MNSIKNSFLIVTSLLTLSSTAMADFRDSDMAHRYRQRHERMDICKEVKEDLTIAEEAYLNFEIKLRSVNQAIKTQRARVGEKERALNNVQNRFNSANSTFNQLKIRNKNK